MSACIHAPVDVAGSLCTDGYGNLLKVQHCEVCEARRLVVKTRYADKPSSGSAWEPWAFCDWVSEPKASSLMEAETAQARRAAWRPVPQPNAADLLDNRELALSHVKMLIAIHGFRPAELVPNSDAAKTS